MNSSRLDRSTSSTPSQQSNPRSASHNVSGSPRKRTVDGRAAPRPAAPRAIQSARPTPTTPVNAAVRRGTVVEPTLDAIERLLMDTNPDERSRGVVALANLQGQAAMNRLANMASRETIVRVVDAIIRVMRQHGTPRQLGFTLFKQGARPELHTEGLRLLVKHPGDGAQREQVLGIITELLNAPSPDLRVQGVNAHAALEGSAGIERLVKMATREPIVRVGDAIIAAVRDHGTPRQLGMTLWGQGVKPALHSSGLEMLVQNAGEGAEREQVRNIITELINSPLPELRVQGVNGHASLEGASGMQRLVKMAGREKACSVVDAILAAVRQYGSQRQLGVTFWVQSPRPELHPQGLDLLVKYPGEGPQREWVRTIITALIASPSPEHRRRGVLAHATLEGSAGMQRLVAMAPRERTVRVVDAILDALQKDGSLRQIGIAQWTQSVRPNLHQRGLDLLVRYPGDGPQREQVRGIVADLCDSPQPDDRIRGLRAHAGLEGPDAAPRLRAMLNDHTYRVGEAARVELRLLGAQARPPAVVDTNMQRAAVTEANVIEAFHNVLRPGLTQAVGRDGQFTLDDVQSVDPALVVAAPALALVHAALNSDGSSISAPLNDGRMISLSAVNCPSSLQPLFTKWSLVTTQIRALNPGDLAALRDYVSNRTPQEGGAEASPDVRTLGTQLVGLGITISQRSTFQRLFTSDLSHVERASANSTQSELDPIMDAIRETLYAALATSIESVPELSTLLQRDPARGYLGSVAFALLDVLSDSVDAAGVNLSIMSGDSPRRLDAGNCPVPMRPLLRALLQARTLATALPPSALTQVRALLLTGSVPTADRRALALAGSLNALAGQVTTLPRFQQTAGEVFAILKAFAA